MEWGDSLVLPPSPSPVPSMGHRVPLSPLDRNMNRKHSKPELKSRPKESLRAVKSLDLEMYRMRRNLPSEFLTKLDSHHETLEVSDHESEPEPEASQDDNPAYFSDYEGSNLVLDAPSTVPYCTSPPHFDYDALGFDIEARKLVASALAHSPSPIESPSKSSPQRHRRGLSRFAAPIGDHPVLQKTPQHTPLNSPKVDQMCIFSAANMHQDPDSPQEANWGSLQDILSILAQKERRVLEAQQALDDAQADLARFRERLDTLMGDSIAPLGFPIKPVLIVRRHQPNLGIHGLHYTRVSAEPILQSTQWTIDGEIFKQNPSLSFRLVHCLLDIVHSIISIFPTHQSQRYQLAQSQVLLWRPDYPSPIQTLYGGLLDYEL